MRAPTVSKKAGLAFETACTFGLSYAETLRRWRASFDARWPNIAPMGFDDRFKRMWQYYLASCEGGFRAPVLTAALRAVGAKDDDFDVIAGCGGVLGPGWQGQQHCAGQRQGSDGKHRFKRP